MPEPTKARAQKPEKKPAKNPGRFVHEHFVPKDLEALMVAEVKRLDAEVSALGHDERITSFWGLKADTDIHVIFGADVESYVSFRGLTTAIGSRNNLPLDNLSFFEEIRTQLWQRVKAHVCDEDVIDYDGNAIEAHIKPGRAGEYARHFKFYRDGSRAFFRKYRIPLEYLPDFVDKTHTGRYLGNESIAVVERYFRRFRAAYPVGLNVRSGRGHLHISAEQPAEAGKDPVQILGMDGDTTPLGARFHVELTLLMARFPAFFVHPRLAEPNNVNSFYELRLGGGDSAIKNGDVTYPNDATATELRANSLPPYLPMLMVLLAMKRALLSCQKVEDMSKADLLGGIVRFFDRGEIRLNWDVSTLGKTSSRAANSDIVRPLRISGGPFHYVDLLARTFAQPPILSLPLHKTLAGFLIDYYGAFLRKKQAIEAKQLAAGKIRVGEVRYAKDAVDVVFRRLLELKANFVGLKTLAAAAPIKKRPAPKRPVVQKSPRRSKTSTLD